jgi:hypothetical protein
MILKSTDKVFVVTELKRKRETVGQLQKKLESYLCTPHTYSLFEIQESLKIKLNRVAHNTDELLHILKMYGIGSMDNMSNVERQFAEYNEIHHEVELYVKSTCQYAEYS